MICPSSFPLPCTLHHVPYHVPLCPVPCAFSLPALQLDRLRSGTHQLSVMAVDLHGLSEELPLTKTFVVDADPPSVVATVVSPSPSRVCASLPLLPPPPSCTPSPCPLFVFTLPPLPLTSAIDDCPDPVWVYRCAQDPHTVVWVVCTDELSVAGCVVFLEYVASPHVG
jgi:hypothetical protein